MPDLWLKYDPSHAYHSKSDRNYIDEIQKWGSKIVHFHAKGGFLSPEGNRDPMGDPSPGEDRDQIKWLRLIQTLMKIEYKGDLCIEIHSDRYSYKETYEVLKRSRDYIKNLLQRSMHAGTMQIKADFRNLRNQKL